MATMSTAFTQYQTGTSFYSLPHDGTRPSQLVGFPPAPPTVMIDCTGLPPWMEKGKILAAPLPRTQREFCTFALAWLLISAMMENIKSTPNYL